MSDNRHAMTVIGPDTHIKGEMVFDSACILGTFEGRITAKGEVEIGEGASCKASIEATTVVVDGTVEGDITTRERCQLNVKARVMGDIVATTLVVAEGASFVGNCRVGADALQAAPTRERSTASASESRRNKPVVVAQVPVTSKVNSGGDLEATLAGLEARLAGLGRRGAAAQADNGTDAD